MKNDKIQLEISCEEALVLFEWLTRFNKSGDAIFEDQAEQRVLWNVEGILESTLTAPFESNYSELLAQARAKVRDPQE